MVVSGSDRVHTEVQKAAWCCTPTLSDALNALVPVRFCSKLSALCCGAVDRSLAASHAS